MATPFIANLLAGAQYMRQRQKDKAELEAQQADRELRIKVLDHQVKSAKLDHELQIRAEAMKEALGLPAGATATSTELPATEGLPQRTVTMPSQADQLQQAVAREGALTQAKQPMVALDEAGRAGLESILGFKLPLAPGATSIPKEALDLVESVAGKRMAGESAERVARIHEAGQNARHGAQLQDEHKYDRLVSYTENGVTKQTWVKRGDNETLDLLTKLSGKQAGELQDINSTLAKVSTIKSAVASRPDLIGSGKGLLWDQVKQGDIKANLKHSVAKALGQDFTPEEAQFFSAVDQLRTEVGKSFYGARISDYEDQKRITGIVPTAGEVSAEVFAGKLAATENYLAINQQIKSGKIPPDQGLKLIKDMALDPVAKLSKRTPVSAQPKAAVIPERAPTSTAPAAKRQKFNPETGDFE